ncbi:endothelin-converting enzyme-like 1 [Penaeus indicus]|uniref:endothelin-converting enzyme-like 1 n=1 Tax=Penaeus indicus TaxID=29960 RepID=UPI00300CEF93
MRELLDTMDEPQDVNSIEWKLKTFYWSCMNVHSYMKSGLDLIKRKIITELYGWNLMRDTWDRRRWEFDVVLTRLHAQFGVSPFFKVTVVPDPRREGHNIIKLVPSGFLLPHRSYYDRMPNNPIENAYKQYIKDTVKLFDASGPDAMEFAAHLFHYESRIAEITPSDDVMRDPLASNRRITIGELAQIARSVPWLNLLRHLFPKSKLDHTSHVLIVSKDYFIDLSELISTTDRSLLNNYLIFNFVSAFMPYMSAENKRVWDLYHMEFTGLQEPAERWQFCIRTTSNFFGLALGSLYERSPRRLKARQKNGHVINKIFNQIRYTVINNLQHNNVYPSEVKTRLSAKLHNMTLTAGYPERLLDVKVINAYYKNYAIFIKDFFQNLQDSIQNVQRQLEKKLLNPLPESPWIDALTGDSVAYSHKANTIVIPPHLLNPPLFHRYFPLPMMYGSIGVQIAREMLRAVGPAGLVWDNRGQLINHTVYTNRTLDSLREESECVASVTINLSVEKDAIVEQTAPDTAMEVLAVRSAYQALIYLEEETPQPHFPSFESYNTTNIFFVAYAGSMCSAMTGEQEDLQRTCSATLMNKAKLKAVLSQLPEFSEAFSCSTDSRHFSRRPCAKFH